MSKRSFPSLDSGQRQKIIATLTTGRMTKYLTATNNHTDYALRLYILNNGASSALFNDIHFLEITLRNKFHHELTGCYGSEWFTNPQFLALHNTRTKQIIASAQQSAAKYWPQGVPLPSGKVVAELTFGFWLIFTERRFEHTLWTPCLRKSFLPRRAPKRSTFNNDLEKIRQLRNRIAHHEAIFHMNLIELHQSLCRVTAMLCPDVAHLMKSSSTALPAIHSIKDFRRRKKL